MWQIENHTPFRAAGTIVVDGKGRRSWVVAVRGVFDVMPNGAVEFAEEQSEPVLAPVYRGKDGESSLVYEADVVAEKPLVDILVNGSAYAPGGKPARSVHVGLRTSSFQKTLTVVGDRVWQGVVPTPSEPLPFTTMPVIYERAFGGFDQSNPDPMRQRMFAPNPVGVGIATRRGDLVGKPAPNVEIPGVGPRESSRAAGFGPVCSYWAPRAKFAGTYDAKWLSERKPFVPEDYDARFLCCAPDDQQVRGRYEGGDRIDVVNMTPEGVFGFEVPRITLGFSSYFSTGRGPQAVEHHRGALRTVIVEPDKRQFVLVWQTTLECHAKIENLDETVVRIKRRVR